MKETLLKEYDEAFFKEHFTWWMNSFCRIHTDRSSDLCSSQLHEIRCPTLVLHGTDDQLIKPSHGKFLADNIKKSR